MEHGNSNSKMIEMDPVSLFLNTTGYSFTRSVFFCFQKDLMKLGKIDKVFSLLTSLLHTRNKNKHTVHSDTKWKAPGKWILKTGTQFSIVQPWNTVFVPNGTPFIVLVRICWLCGSRRADNQDLCCHATLKLSVFDRVQFDAIRVINHFQNHISLNSSVYEISTTTEGTNWKGVSAP